MPNDYGFFVSELRYVNPKDIFSSEIEQWLPRAKRQCIDQEAVSEVKKITYLGSSEKQKKLLLEVIDFFIKCKKSNKEKFNTSSIRRKFKHTGIGVLLTHLAVDGVPKLTFCMVVKIFEELYAINNLNSLIAEINNFETQVIAVKLKEYSLTEEQYNQLHQQLTALGYTSLQADSMIFRKNSFQKCEKFVQRFPYYVERISYPDLDEITKKNSLLAVFNSVHYGTSRLEHLAETYKSYRDEGYSHDLIIKMRIATTHKRLSFEDSEKLTPTNTNTLNSL